MSKQIPEYPTGAGTPIGVVPPKRPPLPPTQVFIEKPSSNCPTWRQIGQVGASISILGPAGGSYSCRSVLVKADDSNAGDVWVGMKAGTGVNQSFRLPVGAAIRYFIDDAGKVYFAITVANDAVTCVAEDMPE